MGKDTQPQKTRSTTLLNQKTTREFSAGGVVYKQSLASQSPGKKLQILWLIRKTSASELYPKQYWMFAKGRIDDVDGDIAGPMASGQIKADEKSLQKAALREVGEETGVEAKIIKKVGTTMYSFTDPLRGKMLKFVTFYLMEYVKDLPNGFDWETAEVVWLPFELAKKQLSFGGEREMLKKANALL